MFSRDAIEGGMKALDVVLSDGDDSIGHTRDVEDDAGRRCSRGLTSGISGERSESAACRG
jgi:hypothetical protein